MEEKEIEVEEGVDEEVNEDLQMEISSGEDSSETEESTDDTPLHDEVVPDKKEAETEEKKKEESAASETEEEKEAKDLIKDEDPESFKKRIGKEVRKTHTAKRALTKAEKDVDYWRDQAQKEKPKDEKKPEVDTTGKPKSGDFEEYDDFLVELAGWSADQRIKKRDEESAAKTQKDEKDKRDASLEDKLDKGREAHDDFDDVFNNTVPVNDAMSEAISNSEQTAEIAYYLGENLDEAERISKLSPYSAVMEIGKIEAKVTTEEKKPPKKKRTSASPPIDPVGASDTTQKGMEQMSNDEYRKSRKFGREDEL